MRLTVALVAVAVLFALATEEMAGAVSPRRIGAVQAHRSAYGTILFDRRGYVLYAFTADSRVASRCSGSCAKAWPPFLTSGKPLALKGVAQRRLGRVRRADGSQQVTYAGHPLYYYIGDRKAGQILCQDVLEFGGRWLVVSRAGTVVR